MVIDLHLSNCVLRRKILNDQKPSRVVRDDSYGRERVLETVTKSDETLRSSIITVFQVSFLTTVGGFENTQCLSWSKK